MKRKNFKNVICVRLNKSVMILLRYVFIKIIFRDIDMNTTLSSVESGGDKHLPETTVQSIAQNLTTMQSIQNVQSVVQSNIQNIQSTQTIVGSVGGTSTSLIGKSMSMDTNSKLPVMKPVVPCGTTSTSETNKITTTICSVGSTVRIISPGMLSTVERQNQPQAQQLLQQTQQVTNMPATYHVPRGPAAVANISAPRSTVATPIVRANTGQTIPTTRSGINTTISSSQWQPKTTSVVYAQPQRHPIPPVSRISRPPSTVYASQQPRLITPSGQGRSVQATMVTGVSGTPSRLIAPVLQANNSITRLPVTQSRPAAPQISNISQTTQPSRPSTQTIQPNQSNRPLSTTGIVNRIAVSAPVVGATNRVTASASVSVQPTVGRQLSINTVATPSTGTVSRIVIPSQQVQQQQQQQQQQPQSQSQTIPRVVQTVTSLSSLNTVSRVIATTASTSNTTRISQPTSTTVARITGMSLHPLPLASARVTSAPAKTVQAQSIGQTVQIKPNQQSGFRVSSASNANNNSNSTPSQSTQGQYLHPPHTATYYSFEPAGTYTQYRQTPVRLLVEPGYDEPHTKTNASPRPSILRKRDHDNSPIKGAAKNLVPVLASLPPVTTSSPPCSPRGDQDGGGCQSSGSTTVSATSSPGLDEEPEQSRITINPTVEMSPRKKPRKQQLTGVELTESRCTEEEMQFITEERMKKEFKEESKEKLSEKRQTSNTQCDVIKSPTQQPTVAIRTRPTPSLLGPSWKNRCGSRLHHYRRPSEVRPREERRPTVAEIAQQKHVLQKLNGWKVYHLTAQMEDIADLEKQVHEKLKTTLTMLESQQNVRNRQDDGLERVNELIKGNMQRSSLISEGMTEARTQLIAIFQHKGPITDILQRCGNKRAQKKRDK
ncbi:histone deacetylase complex subunit SAP130-A-like isoform X2 [Bombus vosnesenskii]|uniref:Histone deacetylase complex subunit SAP130-A-like isoform X2 n=1 Tax=Bombus vosnesenskii TaxID=207650 RepID=A0A6J3KSZ6_9HYME|nr:histone deacetylase complex subunit SAP130-A-like isoform X2 [Bombus vosnesenskii]